MPAIGIRELKVHTSEILRRVQTDRQPIDITLRGEVIARIVPVPSDPGEIAQALAVVDSIEQLAAEIGARYPHAVSVEDIMDDLRGGDDRG